MRRPRPVVPGVALALVGALCADRSDADQSGYYVGGGVGGAAAHIDTGSVSAAAGGEAGDAVGPLTEVDSDLSHVTYDAIVGYRFSPRLALELQYLWLGDTSVRAVADGDATVDGRWRVKGPAVAVIAGWPISSRWDVYGRAGAMFAETDATLVHDDGSGSDPQRVKARETTTELHWGAGFAYHASSQWTFRLEYQQVSNVGEAERTGELDVERYTLGWVYHY